MSFDALSHKHRQALLEEASEDCKRLLMRGVTWCAGEVPHDTSELKDQRTVQPADGSCAGPDSRSAQPDGDTGVVRQDASHKSPAQGKPCREQS